MDLRLISAIATGKIVRFLIHLRGGGATAAPGLYALKLDNNLVKKLSVKLSKGSIIVSGTNGKTTTSRLIADILSKKYKIIHNRQGSNLIRGIASTLINYSSPLGEINCDYAIWEVDEAILPEAVLTIKPKVIILTNLFRDQLDRYGEIDTIRKNWGKALEKLGRDTTLIANADDPGVAFIAKNFKGKVIYFGINDDKIDLPQIEHVADIRFCPVCATKLKYDTLYTGHMGLYSCPNCDFKRPNAAFNATNIKLKPDFSTQFLLSINKSKSTISYQLPGLYNVYNILAASALCDLLGFTQKEISDSTSSFSSAFGRFQNLTIQGKKVILFLIKNPTGANEVLRVLSQKKGLNLLVALNDKIADGRDVSWIWDTNWEILGGKVKQVSVSGIRSWDMTNRLKYADIKVESQNTQENILSSINFTLNNTHIKDTLLILPTYTALLEIQKLLPNLGVNTKWHEE